MKVAVKLMGKMEKKVKKEIRKEVEVKEQVMEDMSQQVEVEVKMIIRKKRNEVKVGEMMKKVKVKMEKNPKKKKKWWKRGPMLRPVASSALDVMEVEADEQLNKDLKRVRQAVDVIKAWKALPPRESDKASVVKMAADTLKLFTMFGSPTPS
ncbi:hypothetical protein Scep_026095 [Stephania cephalantha]|uniref:Uncharacterized protein n=1 Tax=Stephania cephalantha TaxID=152367 RepID=A0AAP0EJG9_9MAGN